MQPLVADDAFIFEIADEVSDSAVISSFPFCGFMFILCIEAN